MDFFEIVKKDQSSSVRLGLINTPHGSVHTPAFLPIGTKGSVKAVTTEELKFWGAEMILANTYHLWQRPGDALIHKAGGLHKFTGWDGPIMTDSGGFQVFSLGEKKNFSPFRRKGGGEEGVRTKDEFSTPSQSPPYHGGERIGKVKVTQAGVEFRNELDGATQVLTPELSVQIQSNLGSDIALVLDDVPGLPASEERIKKSLDLTLSWAERAKHHHDRVTPGSINPGQRLYGIVQGGYFEHFRKKSAAALQKIGCDGYGIGGLAVGESSETMYKVLNFTVPLLEEEKPRHLLGVGYPEQIAKAVSYGIDTFDCVIPTRNARHGQLFVEKKGGKGYELITITNRQYAEDFTPVDSTCNCYACLHHTRAYLRHLFASGEPLAVRLATMHNLRFYLNFMARLRLVLESSGSLDENTAGL